jgi:nucleolar protein 56
MSSKKLYVLFEAPTGYAVFEQVSAEEIGSSDITLQRSYQEFDQFAHVVKLVSFAPFRTAEEALENCNCVAEGMVSDYLNTFLQQVFAKNKKKGTNFELGVSAHALGATIHDTLEIPVVSSEHVLELTRCLRLHANKLLPNHKPGDVERAQCGLTHAYSRNKVKFNVNRADNMIIQSIALLDHMDKGINQLGMRVKEWYGWHFPELAKEVPEPLSYSKIVLAIGSREVMGEKEDLASTLTAILTEEEKAQTVLEKANTSMGCEVSEIDMINITAYAQKVVDLAEYRLGLQKYLSDKLKAIAPNLTTVLGESIAARLISHSGSLTNLAKAPASTIQILGAEKALFRALKKKGNTPKYGLIFHSTFITRASKPNKGRISRYLANKSALAARIDCFMDQPPEVFGENLRDQIEERLTFLEEGKKKPRSNKKVMADAIAAYQKIVEKRERKSKKRLSTDGAAVTASPKLAPTTELEASGEKRKKKKVA